MPKKTLLCIDDDTVVLSLLERFFTPRGYDVLTARDGEEGLALFRSHRPDLVLVDLVMPVLDGFAVLRYLKSNAPDTPVLVVSGEGSMGDVISALRLGAWNYQTKPVHDLPLLEHAVLQALEKAELIKENRAYQQGLESKFAALVDNFPGFVFTCSPERKLTYLNSALKEYLGADPQARIDCLHDFFGFTGQCPWCEPVPMSARQPASLEMENQRDGRWYHVVHSPVFGASGELVERQVIVYDITERKKKELERAEREEYLRQENLRLRASLADRYRFGKIIGKSRAMQEVYESILKAAASDASVIVHGESGTGKELVAQAIHENSGRRQGRLVYVNCGAIPENLIESEFFGYRKGAFSGAGADKAGFLDIAAGGTLFLDEIGEIPLGMQVKLLRALDGNGYIPLGGKEQQKTDVRIVAATNADLAEKVKNGSMRADFFYRIHIIPIHLPPLRERREDIPLLIEHFLTQHDPGLGAILTPEMRKRLEEYEWPGNVRELKNALARFAALKTMDPPWSGGLAPAAAEQGPALASTLGCQSLEVMVAAYEREVLEAALRSQDWHQGRTAAALGVSVKTLFRKMRRLGIARPP